MLERLTRMQFAVVSVVGAFAVAGAIAAILVAATIGFGWYNTAADVPHMPMVAWLLHRTMIRSVKAHAQQDAPRQFSSQQVQQGFAEFEEHCVMCHGGPGVARAKWVMGLEPTPPYLVDAARRWSPGELRYIISHGVKMTAMPAWHFSQSQEDLTSLVAFLEALPNISTKQYAAMRAQAQEARRQGEDGPQPVEHP